ncbi:FkbM family methyltransferase [Flavisolibacter sp. BT320]|nr:FkbM family methyltransferase [Flavisolibacter longurius]
MNKSLKISVTRKFLYKFLQFISFKIIGRKQTKLCLLKLFEALDLDILTVAHAQSGIGIYGNSDQTGEAHFLNKFVFNELKDKQCIIFDVGANIGEYTLALGKKFHLANIYSFEPNLASFKTLLKTTEGYDNIKPVNLGVGKGCCKEKIYSYSTNPASEHASVFKDVLTDIHRADNFVSQEIDIIDLTTFCHSKSIKFIDLLKIDTEGYEMEVLKGAESLIRNRQIGIIQFEFNEMNVISKVFLKDFYQLLRDYKFFRLCPAGMIPLGEYNPSNEVFKYQNIVCILDS